MVMFLYLMVILLIMLLVFLLSFVMMLVTFKSMEDYEKVSPFECGFIGYEESRTSFSIHFFLVSLIFLVFDIELVLMYPFLSEMNESFIFFTNLMMILFVFILSMGLLIEWEKSMLEWKT